ncbi:hypothetical protein J4N46_08885 [Capnocytophaga sp. Marseille-Q4570]|uniref:Uncharacterized protein n=1 Tax=Capnocytophaga bilenii TaxID=2819369 RepID=A0ABS3PYW6_9FLAO|nr:hypothetical protein [Capnocytophaga bilenii]MBO1884528.1 hypothetical protein [Capnocytophaga bilenii]
MSFKIKDPQSILVPKDQISSLIVIKQTVAYSIAKITDHNGKQKIGVRWNVSSKENSDPDKQNGTKECLGFPAFYGNPCWFILPDEFLDLNFIQDVLTYF